MAIPSNRRSAGLKRRLDDLPQCRVDIDDTGDLFDGHARPYHEDAFVE